MTRKFDKCGPLNWRRQESWVGVFDILGFRRRARETEDDFACDLLEMEFSQLLEVVETNNDSGRLRCAVVADTIILTAMDQAPQSYPWFLRQAKNLVIRSISAGLPVRGAISVGLVLIAEGLPVLAGPAFIEAFEYCEDQDWIGLVLAPSATRKLARHGLRPERHGFVFGCAPLKTLADKSRKVAAYRFQDGASNFESPLIRKLRELQVRAPESARQKYENTITHIRKHHRVIE